MKRLATAGFLAGVLLLTGCGKICGQWTLDCIEPESERANFDLKCLVLNDDSTFVVRANEAAKTAEMTGTYAYDANTKDLTFTPANAPPRTYKAQVGLSGKMKVCPTGEKAWTAYLKRCKCDTCQNCGKMCPCPNPCGKNPRCPMAGAAKGDGQKPEQCPMHKTPEPSKNKN